MRISWILRFVIILLVLYPRLAHAATPAESMHCRYMPGSTADSFYFKCDKQTALDGVNTPTGLVSLALGSNNRAGIGWGPTATFAQTHALSACNVKNSPACGVVETQPKTCLALAESERQHVRVWATSKSVAKSAGDEAIDRCRTSGGTQCKITLDACSTGERESFLSVAISGLRRHAVGWGNAIAEADTNALNSCKENGYQHCAVVQRAARTCVALAGSYSEGIVTSATDVTLSQARSTAIRDCSKAGGHSCRALVDGCSFGGPVNATETQGWLDYLLISLNAAFLVFCLVFVVDRALGARVAPPQKRAVTLPVQFTSSRKSIGLLFIVVTMAFPAATVAAFYLVTSELLHGVEMKFIIIFNFACLSIVAVGGLWLSPKLIYVLGYRLYHPDTLSVSKDGILVESLGAHYFWKLSDITGVAIRKPSLLSKQLVLTLQDGVPGYSMFRPVSRKNLLQLGDYWSTPSRFHSAEYLRDVVEEARRYRQNH